MCGILGQIKLKSNGILAERGKFTRALEFMAHRGPDNGGVTVEKEFIFGHRRLSIIDLSPCANQPMVSDDGKVCIVFNGEIYNFQELKEDLLKEKVSFRTHCDTEVLLKGYYEHGIDFIKRCIGMFAFGIYDKRSAKTFLGRDRLGVKPLYYYAAGGVLAFASEIKSILGLGGIAREINMDAVSSYVSFRHPILSDTFFKDIHSLPPGHYMEISEDRTVLTRYWDPAVFYGEQDDDKGEDFYVDRIKGLLSSSIRYRLISDVPVGTLLSGGIDSSVITAVIAQTRRDRINTFTIGYDVDGYNEYEYAGMIAKKYDTIHHEVKGDSDNYFREVEKLIEYKDAPLSIPNEVSQYELCRALKKHVTVILAGTGADEIFCGYGRIFRSVYDFDRYKGRVSLFADGGGDFALRYRRKYGSAAENEIDHFLSIYSYTDAETKRKLFNKDIKMADSDLKIKGFFKNVFEEVKTGRYLDMMGFAFLKAHLPGILHHNDITSMAASVELRVPFLDHRLVEFAMTIPEKYKMKWKNEAAKKESAGLLSDEISEKFDIPKYILKKAYEESIPKGIMERKKVGFPVPLHVWMAGKEGGRVADILSDAKTASRGIFDMVSVRALLDEARKGVHRGDSRTYQFSGATKIWMLFNLEMFFRKYFDRGHFYA